MFQAVKCVAELCINLVECCSSYAADASSTLKQHAAQTQHKLTKKTSAQARISIHKLQTTLK